MSLCILDFKPAGRYKQVSHIIYHNLSSFNNFFLPDGPSASIQSTIRHVSQSVPWQNSYFQRSKKNWSKVLTPFLDSDETIFKTFQFFLDEKKSFKELKSP